MLFQISERPIWQSEVKCRCACCAMGNEHTRARHGLLTIEIPMLFGLGSSYSSHYIILVE